MNKQDPIFVTQAFLPLKEEYLKYLDRIWETKQLTNQGPLLKEFEKKVSNYLGVKNFQFVTNGTLALQLAIDGLGIKDGEIITTPFSYVATTSAILWQRCKPVFVDIDPETFCINPSKIEESITPNTKAILAVHVFGNACDVEVLQEIADKHNIKVIYDGAHAFGSKYNGKSLLDYGDVTICSFHATKLFHTIEGGGVISRDRKTHNEIDLAKRFGHNGDEHIELGINAKASEFQAAMGLTNLRHINSILADRKRASEFYDSLLKLKRPKIRASVDYNYAYYPIVLSSEGELERVTKLLNQENIFPRRYFYPSLNKIAYIKNNIDCPVSEDIASRVICLPLYHGIDKSVIERICRIIGG